MEANVSTTSRRKLDDACCLMFASGAVLDLLFVAKRHFLPDHLPHIDIINTVSIVISTGLISASLFLSLHGTFTVTKRRWIYSGVALTNGVLLVAMFLFLYSELVFMTWTINRIESAPDLFPMLAEQMSKVKDSDDAEKFAGIAYKMYGIRMAYPDASRNQVYYVPSQSDTSFRNDIEKFDSSVSNLRRTSLGLLYGLVDIVLTIFATFSIGLCWATFRRREPTQISSPEIDSLKI